MTEEMRISKHIHYCPCCGSKDHLDKEGYGEDGVAICKKCGAQFSLDFIAPSVKKPPPSNGGGGREMCY